MIAHTFRISGVMIALQSSLRLISVMGLAPNQPGKIKWIYLAIVVYNLVPQLNFLITFYSDIVEVTKSLPLFVENLSLTLKTLAIIYHITEFHALWNGITEFFVEAKQHLKCQEEHTAELRSFGIIRNFGIVIACTWITLVVVPVAIQFSKYLEGTYTDTAFKDPFNNRYFYDNSVSGVYQLSYIMSSLTVASVSFGIVAIDTLFCAMCIHFVGMLQVIKITISTCIPENELTVNTNHYGAEIVVPHVAWLRLFRQFERCFSPIIFLYFLSSSFIICACIFQSTLVENNLSNLVTMVSFSTAGIIQLLMYCWFGTELTIQHVNISDEIYTLPWYKCTPWANKELLIILQVTQKPLVLRGLGLLSCNLECFMNIINFALSVVAVLQSFKT